MKELTTVLLLLMTGSIVAAVFSISGTVPGEWWQWLITTFVLLCAAAVASNEARDE